jgi:hypothetical protein
MVLDSIQPLREMSIGNLPGGKRRSAGKADNLTAICERILWWARKVRYICWEFLDEFRDCSILKHSSQLSYSVIVSKSYPRNRPWRPIGL